MPSSGKWVTCANSKSGLVPFLDRVSINGFARGRGINDAGVITGFASDELGNGIGFLGGAKSGFQLLTVPGATPDTGTVCEGINNLGQVTCGSADAAGNSTAFIGSPSDDNEQ